MQPLSVIVLANWGIGRAMLATLLDRPEVTVTLVVTRHAPDSVDPYANAVRDLALGRGLPTLPSRGLDHALLAERASAVDLLLCHAYMRLLPPAVTSAPRLGAVNIHASLLPRWRGPSPTWWALTSNDAETGLSAHFMTENLDAGDIIHQVRTPLVPGEGMDPVLDRLCALVPDLVHGTLARLAQLLQKDFTPQPQCEREATFAPRPSLPE